MTESRHAAFLAARRFPSLDGLRCLAILPVIWHHSTPRPLPGVLGRGPLGVHLFFAVSGFLITTLLVREKRRDNQISLSNFYARRSLRIFPLYYAVLGSYAARGIWLLPPSPMRDHFLHNLPYFGTYTTNIGVDFGVAGPVIFGFSWSLATEEQFYLLWPPVLAWIRTRSGPVLVALSLFLLDFAAEHGVLSRALGTGALFRAVTSISAPICLGSLLALGLDDARAFSGFYQLLGHRSSAPFFLLLLGGLMLWNAAPLLLVHLSMVGFVGSVCIRPDHGLQRWLEAPALVHVGTVSYGMYLFHVAAITFVKSQLAADYRPAWLVFVLAVPLTVVAATLSYRFFEQPFLAIRERFRGHSDEVVLAAVLPGRGER